MSTPSYTYYVTIGAVETQVYPYGDWSLKVAKAEEDFPFCKDYRIKAEGDFIFGGDDYTLLRAADCCDKIDLRIQCDGVNYWFGYFAYPYDFDVDEDKCTITSTPKPLDKYYYFDLYADEEYTDLTRSTTFQYQDDFPDAIPNDNWSICLPCELLWDVITAIATNPPCEPSGFAYVIKSTFFENDLFPDGTNPYPTDNYVTGCPNKLNHIVMAMAEDICSLETVLGNLEPMPEWSWNDLMELIHNVFNTWWYVDEAGNIRVEHIYFWELYFPVSYDLTTIDGGRWLDKTNKYSYNSNEIPLRETWLFSENQDGLQDSYITYYGCYLPGIARVIKEYSLTNLVTYIEWIAPGTNNFVGSPALCSDIKSEDYMFIRCIPRAEAQGLGYNVNPACPWCAWFSRTEPADIDHVNGHFWPLNLLINYWMHDRPLWEGIIPLLGIDPVIFESVHKNLLQVELILPICCDGEAVIVPNGMTGAPGTDPRYLYQFGIDFNETIITQYGDGELYTGTIKDGTLSVQLVFEDLACEEDATEWSDISEI